MELQGELRGIGFFYISNPTTGKFDLPRDGGYKILWRTHSTSCWHEESQKETKGEEVVGGVVGGGGGRHLCWLIVIKN